MSQPLTGPLDAAVQAALEAGALLRGAFHQPAAAGDSPGHCQADIEAEHLIRARLTTAFPDWGYRGEETGDLSASPGGEYLWLVDPNDGTAAYQRGYRGSAVSIALLHERVPVLGVVYVFAAPDDHGDLFSWAEGLPLSRQGRPLDPRAWHDEPHGSKVAAISQSADRAVEANQRCIAPLRYRAVPSIAYRLALVAAGEADAAVSLSGPGDWDYAGGHALLRAAGGILIDERGHEISYDSRGRSSSRYCFGGDPAILRTLQERPWGSVLGRKDPPADPSGLPYPARLKPGLAITDPGLLSRAQGCLLGQLAGDSLGSLVEFQHGEGLRARFPEGIRYLLDGGVWGIMAGQPTDDSEMALVLARSIVAESKYDDEKVARAYRYWYLSRPFDMGGTTRQALDATVRVDDAARAARGAANRGSQANGSLMRISPLGIYGHALNPEAVADLARRDSALTHPHPVCQEACAAFTIALAHGIRRGGSPEGAYGVALDWARSHGREEAVLSALEAAASAPPADYTRHQGWVLIALHNAFYQLLHAGTVETGVVASVMAGGDTDTNAAIAGALLGAVHGREAIPAQWRRMVTSCRPVDGLSPTRHPRPRAFWPADALELAELLALTGSEPSVHSG